MNTILKKYCLSLKKTGQKKFLNLPLWLWFLMALLSMLKIWLVAGQHMLALGFATFDDRLFLNLANNILHFQWLGNYNNLTLAKGPFYPIWIALSYAVHIPLLYSQQLLYIFACVILVIALQKLIPKPAIMLIFFAVLLFNPMSFTDGAATRVIREGIYPALTILTLAFFAGMIFRTKNSLKILLMWSLCAGISLSCFWLTREEGVWIMPITILVTTYSAFIVWKARDQKWMTKLMMLIVPFLMLGISTMTISAINYHEYSVFNTVEFKNASFLNAYGALTRVKSPIWMPDVPVSVAQRQIIYSISPLFSKLKPFLEGDLGKGWASNAGPDATEIQGGWFMWAFRDAVAMADSPSVHPVYRLYNPKISDHYFTMSEQEAESLENISPLHMTSEGISFYAYSDPSIDNASVPIYRYSNLSGSYYFSTSLDATNIESNSSTKTVAFYAYPNDKKGTSPVYDFKINDSDKHFYTISVAEKDSIVANLGSSYKLQGIAFYAYPSGYYYSSDGKAVMVYYQQLADEINSACDSGKISCYGKRSSMMPPWNSKYNTPALNYVYQGLSYAARFKDFTATPTDSIGDAASLSLFSKITRGDVEKKTDISKISALNNIGKAYVFVSPIAILIALLIFLFQLFTIRRSIKNPKFIICFSVVASIFARVMGLALISATSFSTINNLYLSPIHPLLLLFILLNFSVLFDYFLTTDYVSRFVGRKSDLV